MTWVEIKNWMLNQLSYPGALQMEPPDLKGGRKKIPTKKPSCIDTVSGEMKSFVLNSLAQGYNPLSEILGVKYVPESISFRNLEK